MLDQHPTSPFPHRFSGDSAYSLARGAWSLEAVRSGRIELPGTLEAAAYARRAVEDHLGRLVDDLPLRDVCLMVSELATNAVLHGPRTSGAVMYLAASPRCLRVEVCDGGSGFDFPRGERPEGVLGGFGLRIVDAMASRWGVAGDDGTCVWFELDLKAGSHDSYR
jgi:anti-sigma regulatory factor (Ser/Thr protein kinase)